MSFTNGTINGRSSRILRHVAPTCAVFGLVTVGFLYARPPGAASDPPPSTPDGRIRIDALNTPGDKDGETPSLYKITKPGSYYLAGNLTGVAGRSGIEIASSGVTIDLMGFELAGVPGTLSGIECHSGNGIRGIEIRNGTIRGWGVDGIDVKSTPATNGVIEHIRAFNNNRRGIAAGQATIVRNCVASHNLGEGIAAGSGCSIVQCVAYRNVQSGITAGVSSIIDCIAHENLGNAIAAYGNCLVRGNKCYGDWEGPHRGSGIRVEGSNTRIEGNSCTYLTKGIEVVGTGNFIVNNTCADNEVNWDLHPQNVWGTIHDLRDAKHTDAVKGNSAPGTLPKDADGHANWTY